MRISITSRVRAVAALTVSLLTWALSDVQIWNRIFERGHLDHVAAYDAAYQVGHHTVLVGLLVVGVVALSSRWSLWYAGALWTIAYGGLADVFYYLLDWRPLPDALPWLDAGHPLVLFHPVTQPALIASTALWLALWGASLWFLPAIGRCLAVALRWRPAFMNPVLSR
jgi:hypothetical protein